MVRCARIRPEFLPKNDHARGTGRHCLGFETMAARRDCRRTRSGELDGVMTPSVSLGIGPVSFPDLVAVARDGAAVSLDAEAVTALERARAVVVLGRGWRRRRLPRERRRPRVRRAL